MKPTRPRTVPNQSTFFVELTDCTWGPTGIDDSHHRVAVGPNIGGLDVRLGAKDEPGVELIIVAELSAAHDALQILSGGPGRAERRRSKTAGAKIAETASLLRAGAESVTDVDAPVETRPGERRRKRRRRSLIPGQVGGLGGGAHAPDHKSG